MLGGGHINADMQQFLEKDKKAGKAMLTPQIGQMMTDV